MKPHSSKVDKGRSQSASQSSSRQPAWWSLLLRAAGLSLGTVVCVMVLSGASGQEEKQDSRKKIEAMSPAQRDQLKRNYEKYQKLTPAEKKRYREIHEATHSQPELNRVMRSYCNWVKTLSPWEQEDLRKASPEERMELIRKYRSQRKESNRRSEFRDYFEISKILNIDFREPRMQFMRIPTPPPPALFQEVIGIIEQSLPTSDESLRPKNQESELAHSLAVLRTALRPKHQKGGVDSNNWPPAEMVEQIQKLFDDNNYSFRDSEKQRKFKAISPRDEMQVKLFLAKGLMDQLFSTVKQELAQLNLPEDELQKFFETELDTKDRDSLMKYPPEELQKQLKYLYLRKHMPPEVKQTIEKQSAETHALIFRQLFRGVDMQGIFRDLMKEMQERRFNGPKDRGDRRLRGRNPGQGPPRLQRKQPDA